MKNLLTIKEAAQFLGVSEMTLRRWDKNGLFKPTFISPGKHRLYSLADLETKTKGIFRLAQEWARTDKPFVPRQEFYCPTSDIWKARHEKMANEMAQNSAIGEISSLIASAVGEIGNNSFDHNLGNWPDIAGAFFAYDLGKRRIVLADRGLGVLTTLRQSIPDLKNDEEALNTAFTQVVTGRAPEHRGNGLKYVRAAIMQAKAHLLFQSGNAIFEIENNGSINNKIAETSMRGCLAMIEF